MDLLEGWRSDMSWGGAPGITVVRGRVCLLVLTDGAAPTQDSVTWGLLVFDQNTTPADLPSPQLNPGNDWMAYCRHYAGAKGGQSAGYEVDVKSMRKLEEMQQTVWFVHSFDATGEVTVLYAWSLLLALP